MGERDRKPANSVKRVPAAPKKFHLRMRLLDYYGKPLPENTQCFLTWSKTAQFEELLVTDANGVIDFVIPLTKDTKPVWHLEVSAFKVGYMGFEIYPEAREPGDSVTGARMRLNNLGYLIKSASNLKAPLDDATRRGIERFQAANRIFDKTNLPANNTLGAPSGKLDAQTKNRLEEAHDTDTGALLK